MVVAKFPAVVVEPPPAQQVTGARVMETRVVQDDESGIADQVGPHVVVARGVAQLVDDEVVRRTLLLPDEVVRVKDSGGGRAAGTVEAPDRAIDKPVDGVAAIEARQDFRAVRRDARRSGRQGRKPRDAQGSR